MAKLKKAMNGLRHCCLTSTSCKGCPYAKDGKMTPDCQRENGIDALTALEAMMETIQQLALKIGELKVEIYERK